MTGVDVIGGVYRERCAFPHWEQIFGSAGRAAVALATHVPSVRLHTFLATNEVENSVAHFGSFGIDVSCVERETEISFDYLHTLANPVIAPAIEELKPSPTLSVSADTAILFGALEGNAKLQARRCVYDPQSAFSPTAFRSTGSVAEHLAVVLNHGEAIKLVGECSIEEAAEKIAVAEGAEIVVVKNGIRGAYFWSAKTKGFVPAYRAESVFTIGSGDVFVAAFALAWAVNGVDVGTAVVYASKATASYVETRSLPILALKEVANKEWHPAVLKDGNVYLAGPFREVGQRVLINDARQQLTALGMKVFSPIHDIGPGPAEKVVGSDLAALSQCDAVFAFLNGSSPGTVFEVGYARGLQKPTYCVAQNMRQADLKLPIGSGCFVYDDYVTALHKIAWRD